MNKLFDLRFVIGIFFILVGGLLLVYGFTCDCEGQAINQLAGGVFLLFGVGMWLLSRIKGNTEADSK